MSKEQRNDNKKNQRKNSFKIEQPLSQKYKDKAEIFLDGGIAYKTAQLMGEIPPHQLRKILDVVKESVNMVKKDSTKFEDARNILYHVVPLTAYNTGRNPKIKPLYYFVQNHINEKSIQSNEDIIILDQLFTSIIAYHKFLKK